MKPKDFLIQTIVLSIILVVLVIAVTRQSSALLDPWCGDGLCNGGESCYTCSGDCGPCPPAPRCGDGVINQPSEQCETNAHCNDHDPYTTDTCSNCKCSNVRVPYCGDGVVGSGEECELKNTNDNSYCDQTTTDCDGTKYGIRDSYGNCDSSCFCVDDPFDYECVEEMCGAECDSDDDCYDQDPYTTDICLSDCTCEHIEEPYCGDGIIQSSLGEECDDGNNIDGDGCDANCQDEYCGDGVIQSGLGEECEDNLDCSTGEICTDCLCERVPSCGDGILDTGEECDDGNNIDGDGCNSNCLNEYCGDGIIQSGLGEECEIDDDCDQGEYCSDCVCEPGPYCGDGHIDPGEECEPPGVVLSTCSYGADYLQDYCDLDCQLQDDDCEDDYPGCTSDPECDEFIPGTGDCDLFCQVEECIPEEEVCNGEDDDCDDCIDEEIPAISCQTVCGEGVQYCYFGDWTECYGPLPFPEICDGEDNDCDEEVDEDPVYTVCDEDSDCGDPTCVPGAGIQPVCINPGTCNARCGYDITFLTEICENQIDDDCDGLIDENDPDCYTPECGNGILDPGEECEPPNNSLATCGYGFDYLQDYCNSDCQYEDDYCENEWPGCTSDPECDELEPGTGGCDLECHYTIECGDGDLDIGEECELPSTSDHSNCDQSVEQCVGVKLGTRDSFGDCDSSCLCEEDEFTLSCVQWECGAQCDEDSDCDDQDPLTMDICNLDTCSCEHDLICGNEVIDSFEDCELPNTLNNIYCGQTTTYCDGLKFGTRDSYGNCDSSCECVEDSFSYECVEGLCGAECDQNSDCCPNFCFKIYSDECDGHKLVEYNSNSIQDFTPVYDSCDNACTDGCECTDCLPNCSATPADPVCVEGVCGAECDEHSDCGEGTCGEDCTCQPYCGNNEIDPGEDCELPDTTDNLDCDQPQTDCDGNKQGIRDAYGNCDLSCGCVFDDFVYSCNPPECGAQCVDGESDSQQCGTNVGECEQGEQWRTCSSDCLWGDWGPCRGEIGPVTEICDGLDNDCDGDIDEDIDPIPCGSGDCEGVIECIDGAWTEDCSTFNDDCGICAKCDASGECTVYDGTQDSDCPDTICEDECTHDPDNNPFTWDFADDVPNECLDLFTCTENSCEYEHECDLGCGADCLIGVTGLDMFCGPDTDEGECEYGSRTRHCLFDCTWSEWDECMGGVYPTDEVCDGLDNDCDGLIDEGIAPVPCGSGDCAGISECVAGVWTDCSTLDDDCGVCALCDSDGECTVYDETQDGDCSDTICDDECEHSPDDDPVTWDYADDVPNECTGLFTCTENSCEYEHECDLGCGAECEQHSDCGDLVDCIIEGNDDDDGSKFAPRVYVDDDSPEVLYNPSRTGAYAFEGEQIKWDVLVWDKNGVPEKIYDVFVAVALLDRPTHGNCTDCECEYPDNECIEANCRLNLERDDIVSGMTDGQYTVESFDSETMAWYECILTVESKESMYGQYEVQPQAIDNDGLRGGSGPGLWFFNPEIIWTLSDPIEFEEFIPGHTTETDTIYISNDAESSVKLEMRISGKNFYDSSHSGGMCPTSNVLLLNNGNDQGGDPGRGCDGDYICYKTTGSPSTSTNWGNDGGWDSIPYETYPLEREPIIDNALVLDNGDYISIKFRISPPEPCNGDFRDGTIYIWGEPI